LIGLAPAHRRHDELFGVEVDDQFQTTDVTPVRGMRPGPRFRRVMADRRTARRALPGHGSGNGTMAAQVSSVIHPTQRFDTVQRLMMAVR